MNPQSQTQQEFLKAAKAEVGMTWDQMALEAGIQPRALKNYRMPDGSQNHREMPHLAWLAVQQMLILHRSKAMVAGS